MTAYLKRLIEVDLPTKWISVHARREKSIRHGHISTLHIWWARRPLAACRAFKPLQWLLAHGADRDARNKSGKTAAVIGRTHAEVVRFLTK